MMNAARSLLRFVVLAAPLALVACADTAMPTGYTYHNEVYKAPPGPEASPPAKIVKTTGMNNMGTETVTMSSPPELGPDGLPIGGSSAYDGVADDLVARMIRNFGRPMEPVFVNDSSPMAPSLRGSLKRNGIPVAVNPGDGPFVLDNAVQGANASITFFSNHDRVTSESGSYPVAR